MPDISLLDLSKYRLNKAAEMLETAKRDLAAGDYASANNRAYYCIFHAMRAVLALNGEDFKKHSAVIAKFAQEYLKTDILPRELSKVISNASLILYAIEATMRIFMSARSPIPKCSFPTRRAF